MRIGIDVRYLSHGLFGGVHTYVKHFVPALIEAAAEHQVFLYADTKRPFELTHLPRPATLRLLPYRGPASSVYLDFALQRAMARDGVEVAHFPANYGFGPAGARTVITLHDALNLLPLAEILRGLRTSNAFNPRNVAMFTYLRSLTRLAVRRAHLIITDSTHARQEIVAHGGLPARRILVAPLAQDPTLRRVDDPQRLADMRERHGLKRPFVLADALKNPAVLIRAWGRLPAEMRERFQMVFFCRRPDPLPIIREAEAAGHARLLVRPVREDLIALYSQAEAFVFPSWIEGFGLPVLEAMTCGAPVIASDRGSIPEVAGEAAVLIDAEDDAALAAKLTRILGDPAEAALWRGRGFARAALFSWRGTAQSILDAYRQALELPPAARLAAAN